MLGSLFSGLFGSGGEDTASLAVNTAKEYAERAVFNPYTVTTASGTAGYEGDGKFFSELSPEYQAILEQALGGAESLFGQFAAFDPAVRAKEIFEQQRQDVLDPAFTKQRQELAQDVFRTGRAGLQIAGDVLGAGADSGLVQPDVYGLSRSQSQTLAELAGLSRTQAFGEQAQLGTMASQALQSGLGISGLENTLVGLGLTAEQARGAAELAAGQLELAPLLALANLQQQSRGQSAGFFGSLFSSAMGTKGLMGA